MGDSLDTLVDTITISLNKGHYEANVKGKRKGEEEEQIHSFGGNHFEDIVTGFFDYHFKCFMLMEENGGQRNAAKYSGAGSDNGEWNTYWMVKWHLQTGDDFTNVQSEILRGITFMHNQQVGAYGRNEKLKETIASRPTYGVEETDGSLPFVRV